MEDENANEDELEITDEMVDNISIPENDKVFSGAYKYISNNDVYCEEEFEIGRNNKELNFTFSSDVHSRTSTGELLKIHVDYIVNKNYIPLLVKITKELGNKKCLEQYSLDYKTNMVKYHFNNYEDPIQTVDFSVPGRFHIATPATCCSVIFVLAKKLSQTGKTTYISFRSPNHWEYIGPPQQIEIGMEKAATMNQTLQLGNNVKVSATHWKLFEEEKDSSVIGKATKNENPPLDVYLSKHMSLPYLISASADSQVIIKYLNELDPDA